MLGVLICLCGCSNVNNPPIIKFSTDSTAILIKDIDKVSLLQLKNLLKVDSGIDDFLKIMILVSPKNSLTDNQVLTGTVKVLGDSLTFVPIKHFMPGQSYLVESYIGAQFGSVGQMLKGKGQTTVHPQRKILRR